MLHNNIFIMINLETLEADKLGLNLILTLRVLGR